MTEYTREVYQTREMAASFVVQRNDLYQFRKDKKWHWLQRLCFKVLAKIGAFHLQDQVKYERVRIDGESFIRRLFECRADLFRHMGEKPTTLLIGSKDYAELMMQPEINQMMSFPAPTYRANKFGESRVMDLEVKVIPWMVGMVVMP